LEWHRRSVDCERLDAAEHPPVAQLVLRRHGAFRSKEGLMADTQSRTHRFRVSGIAAHVREGAAAFPCQLEELAADGAFLRTGRVIEVGTTLEVDLVKPGGRKPLHLRAVVLRTVPGHDGHQPGLDVEFRMVPPDDFQRLVAWLEEMKTRAAKAPAHGSPAAAVPAVPAAVLPAASTDPVQADTGVDGSKLMLQIKGLLLEMDDLRDRLRLRDIEVDDLRRQLSTAEQLLGRRTSN